jgi:hypothetical protein
MDSYELKTMQSLPQAKLYAYGPWATVVNKRMHQKRAHAGAIASA